MYTKVMVGAVVFYPIALMVASYFNSPIVTRILAVTAGIIGFFHIAYEALWRIDTTWRKEGQTSISYIGKLVRNTMAPIAGTLLIATSVWMIWRSSITGQIIGFGCIATVTFGTCLSVGRISEKTYEEGGRERIT